jgi:hypothetical protein
MPLWIFLRDQLSSKDPKRHRDAALQISKYMQSKRKPL